MLGKTDMKNFAIPQLQPSSQLAQAQMPSFGNLTAQKSGATSVVAKPAAANPLTQKYGTPAPGAVPFQGTSVGNPIGIQAGALGSDGAVHDKISGGRMGGKLNLFA